MQIMSNLRIDLEQFQRNENKEQKHNHNRIYLQYYIIMEYLQHSKK